MKLYLIKFFIVIIIFSINLLAQTPVTQPGSLSNENTTYILQNNITASSTAIVIDANNITFDLNGKTIVFGSSSSGNGIVINGDNCVVKNGYINNGNTIAPAVGVDINGQNNKVFNLEIYIKANTGSNISTGVKIDNGFNEVYRIYVKNTGVANVSGYAPHGIMGDSRNYGGIIIRDNIIVGPHNGIGLELLGYNVDDPDRSFIYRNKIQHKRSPGVKAPYALTFPKCRNIDIYENTIISDEGRGIIIEGWGQGVPRGSDYINVYNNRFDCEYNVKATDGTYVENNVWGLYTRYSTHDINYHDNVVLIDNNLQGGSACFFSGSDANDPLQYNIYLDNNILINRDTDSELDWSICRIAVNESVFLRNNQYFGYNDIPFWVGNWSYHNDGGVDEFIVEGNTLMELSNYIPNKPSNLKIVRFWDDYMLTWDDNLDQAESQTYEYQIYKDGNAMDMSYRGGTFFIDTNVTGSHSYQIQAVNLNNQKSEFSNSVSTDDATIGWDGNGQSPAVIDSPKNIRIVK